MSLRDSAEIHLHPRNARGRIRTVRFSPRGKRFGLALLVAYLLFLAGLTLLLITLLFNIIGHVLRKRFREAY